MITKHIESLEQHIASLELEIAELQLHLKNSSIYIEKLEKAATEWMQKYEALKND